MRVEVRAYVLFLALDLGGDVTGAGRRQLVCVDKEAAVGVTWVEREHTMDDVLLKAFAVMARGQRAASGLREEAGFDSLRLSVISHVLDDYAPFAFSVLSAEGPGILDIAGANETLTADPVAFVKLFSVVEGVIKFLFLRFSHAVHQIIGRLISDVGVLLQRQRIIVDGVLRRIS